MSSEEAISRREQLQALVRVGKYRPVFTAAIIGAGVFAAALEAGRADTADSHERSD